MVDVVPTEEDSAEYVGMLKVEAASGGYAPVRPWWHLLRSVQPQIAANCQALYEKVFGVAP